MEETVNQEVKEMPEAEVKAPVPQRAFKIKSDARLTIEGQEISFLINIAQGFLPFVTFSKGITEVAAFGEYLKSKLLETKQVEFLDTPPEGAIITDVREPDTSEAEVQAEQELSKMRVVHNANKVQDIQEELANQ